MNDSLYPELHDDDHVKFIGDEEWHTVRDLRAAARNTPPNAYEHGVAQMRAAAATSMSTFEDQYKASRLHALAEEHAEADANPLPRLAAAEAEEFAPPDAYAAGIRQLQENK